LIAQHQRRKKTMSGYRTIHRERIFPDGDTAIWSVQMTACSGSGSGSGSNGGIFWRIFVASSDGYLRVYLATEKSIVDSAAALDASALQIQCTHTLLGATQQQQQSSSSSSSSVAETAPASSSGTGSGNSILGCTQVSTVRNYVGDDTNAGDLVVASMDLGGTVRLWCFDKSWEEKTTTMIADNNKQPAVAVRCKAEFVVDQATGTTLALASPKITTMKQQRNNKDIDTVLMAVGCLNGTISLISTGIAVPSSSAAKANKDIDDDKNVVVVPAAGTVVE
jgi:hypothetical protein